MSDKYQIGMPTDMVDFVGKPILVGDVVYCPDNSAWEYHFTTIGESDARCENANNLYMSRQPRVNLGPYWANLHLKFRDGYPVISDDDLAYHWNTTRAEAIKKYYDEAK